MKSGVSYRFSMFFPCWGPHSESEIHVMILPKWWLPVPADYGVIPSWIPMWSAMVSVQNLSKTIWFFSVGSSLSMFFRYVWAFRTRVLKTRVPERAFWVNPFFQWYKVNLFPVFEQRNIFSPLKKRIWSSCGLKMVDAATRRLISDLPWWC